MGIVLDLLLAYSEKGTVGSKDSPRWLWHAIDRRTGQVLAYVFGRRQDEVFLQLKELLEPFGISAILYRWLGSL